jgi:CSLREA domain-containing protein
MSLRGSVLPLLVAAVVAVVTAVSAASASATTLTVNTTQDSTGNLQCSLREAIDAVDSPGASNLGCPAAAFGSNTIMLPAGTYHLGFPGQLTISPTVTNLTIQGAGESKTTIVQSIQDRLLQIAVGARVAISDLTLTGGRASTGSQGSPAGFDGGAILNHGVLSLTDAAITNSQAGTGSGPSSPPSGAAGGSGGLGGAIYNSGAVILTGVSISSDQAGAGGSGDQGTSTTATGGPGGDGGIGGSGGGVASTGTLSVNTSTFRDDTAGSGGTGGPGGVPNPAGTGGNGGNGALGGSGGAIAVLGGAFQITNSTFASNSAAGGGAGGNGGAGTQAGGNGGSGGNGGDGGAVWTAVSGGVQSSTMAGNDAGFPNLGGTAGNGSPAGTPGANGVTGFGGGVAAPSAALTLQNSLLAESSNGNCFGSVVDGGHDLSFDGAGCPTTFAGGDPNLGGLQNNGGPTSTISLQPGSAAIDQVPAKAGCQATDQRGVRRPSGSACDIGAYEVAPPSARTTAAQATGKTAETLTAIVTPNAGAATVMFAYGTTTKTTSISKTVHTSGVVATPVQLTVRGLHPSKRYYYKVTIQAPDGSTTGSIRSFKTARKPAIQSLHVAPSSFRAAGTTLTYTDTASGRTKIEVLKPETRHQFEVVAHSTHQDKAGKRQRVHVSGRHLAQGSYVIKVIGSAGQSASAKVRVL